MLQLFFVLAAFLVVVGALALIARRLGLLDDQPRAATGSRQPVPPPVLNEYPYRKKQYLLSKAERSFFGVLQLVVGDRYLICPMVRLADVIDVKRNADKAQSHRNRIDRKHLDFVLCHPDTVSPVLAIELDDASHDRADRRDRDHLVDHALAAAGLPLLRVKAQQAYATGELGARLRQLIR